MTYLFRFLSLLPLPVLHNLGALGGWLIWFLSPTYRRNFSVQIRQAGLVAARSAAIAESGKALFELPRIWLRPKEDVLAQVVRVSGWEHVECAHQAGRGIMFLTPHLGCFEIAARYYASHKPITVLYRRPRQAWLASLIDSRRAENLQLAPADLSGVRRLIKALKKGEAIGILPDQVPGNGEGIWAPLFGRPAYTMTLAARLAATGPAVLLAFAERLPYGAGFHVQFMPLSQSLEGDLSGKVSQINGELEVLIRRCPSQYLWGYNRYKQPAGAESSAS